MKVTEDLSELRSIRATMEGPFGLVPTMGALHTGHASLVTRARAECRHVGASIFVNPSQFGPGEDFRNYPRTVAEDLAMLETLGVDLVWLPTAETMYSPGYQTWITVENLAVPLEGKSRPGHFRGVATVVAKLFNCFLPDRAYFGQKDAQQVAVLKRLVQDLNFAVQVIACPTVRESDGLALSSRNRYLNAEERESASVLYRALCAARERFDQGERNADALREAMSAVLRSEPLANQEYVSAADPETLEELRQVNRAVLLSMAVRIGKARLIDNMVLGE